MSIQRVQPPVDIEEVDHSASDHTITGGPSHCLWVSVTGDIEVTLISGTKTIIENVPVGWLQIRAKTVHTANTTATVSHAGLYTV